MTEVMMITTITVSILALLGMLSYLVYNGCEGKYDPSPKDLDEFWPDTQEEIVKFNELYKKQKGEDVMTVHKFAVKVTKLEGKKISISIAQVKEVLKITNTLLKGQLYKLIRKL